MEQVHSITWMKRVQRSNKNKERASFLLLVLLQFVEVLMKLIKVSKFIVNAFGLGLKSNFIVNACGLRLKKLL